MGKNKDGKNPFYKGEAGTCKSCKKPQTSILRHINKKRNKTCSKLYTEEEYRMLRLKSNRDPEKLERIRKRRRLRYLKDKYKGKNSSNPTSINDKMSSEETSKMNLNPFLKYIFMRFMCSTLPTNCINFGSSLADSVPF